MQTTGKKSRFTLFFAKLPQGRIDPRVRINATFDVIRDCLYAKDFRLRPEHEELEIVRHAVAHLIHQASAMSNFVFWNELGFDKNPLRGVLLEPSPSRRNNMLLSARRRLGQSSICFADLVISLDSLHVAVCSMAEQFFFGTGEGFRYESWEPQLAIYMCAAQLPTMEVRLRTDWTRIRARILERSPRLLKDIEAA